VVLQKVCLSDERQVEACIVYFFFALPQTSNSWQNVHTSTSYTHKLHVTYVAQILGCANAGTDRDSTFSLAYTNCLTNVSFQHPPVLCVRLWQSLDPTSTAEQCPKALCPWRLIYVYYIQKEQFTEMWCAAIYIGDYLYADRETNGKHSWSCAF